MHSFPVLDSAMGDGVSGGVDGGHYGDHVAGSRSQICQITGQAGVAAGWRSLLVTVGEPADPESEPPMISSARAELNLRRSSV
jgi:hypothetical protein